MFRDCMPSSWGIVAGQAELHDFELEHNFPQIGQRIIRLDARRMQGGPRPPLLLVTIDDVTDRERAEREVRESRELLRSVLDSMPQKISTSTSNGDWDYLNPQWTDTPVCPSITSASEAGCR